MDDTELQQHLRQNGIQPVYYFCGEENLTLQGMIRTIKQMALPEGLEDFNFEQYAGDKVTPKQIAEMAMNLPFMADRRVLLITEPLPFISVPKSDKKGTELLQPLLDYLEAPNPQCCLILCGDKMPSPKIGTVGPLLLKTAVCVEFAPLKDKKLQNWIENFVRNCDMEIDEESTKYLSSINAFSLEMLTQEMGKLTEYTLAQGQKRITMVQVHAIVTKTLESSVFDLTDAMGNKQGDKAIQVVRELLLLGQTVPIIMATVVTHFQRLLSVKDYREQHIPDQKILDDTGMHPFVLKKTSQQCAKFTLPQLVGALEELMMADARIKSYNVSAEKIFEEVILKICYFA